MSKLKCRLIIGLLLFSAVNVFCPFLDQPDLAAQDIAGVRAGDFAPGQLEAHYLKHGYQFGQITQTQYLQDAQALLDASAGEDILEKIRPNGDVLHYRVSSGEFAVMTKRGRIRTYFKTNYGYWLKQ